MSFLYGGKKTGNLLKKASCSLCRRSGVSKEQDWPTKNGRPPKKSRYVELYSVDRAKIEAVVYQTYKKKRKKREKTKC